MVDNNVILRKIVALEEYLQDLSEAKNISFQEFSSSKINRRYIERTLHMAIEACIDISNHIISYDGFREPISNKDTFQVLTEVNIISVNLSEKLQKMAQFRNIIVHDYVKIQPEIVFSIVQKNVVDIIDFVKIIRDKYL